MFDAVTSLTEIRHEKDVIRKHSKIFKSRLDPFAFEIHSLRKVGARPAEIQFWLRKNCRTKVALTTVTRWLNKHEN